MTDWNLTYCGVRSRLEEHGLLLVSKLFSACDRLLRLVGKDHQAFLLTRSECGELREQLCSSNAELQEHRTNHGC